MNKKLLRSLFLLLVTVAVMTPLTSYADDGTLKIAIDTLWVMLAGFLVFFMNTGFGLLESGLARSKNAVNIISKNFVVFAIATLAYYAMGWGLMFGNGNGFAGSEGLFFLSGADNSPATGEAYKGAYSAIAWTGVPLTAKFFFQLVFAATAATIVSGAVAERIKYVSFLVFSVVLCMFIYPLVGHWIWGGGWLASKGFFDFAGSTVVHSTGGWAALAAVLVLGPRLGKYRKDGKIMPIPGHNMTSAFIGCFILWLGWFGFNPGSTMSVGDGSSIAHIALTTNFAAAAGTISATIVAWLWLKKPDISMTLNGCLAGLVGVTASCAVVSIPSSIIIGAVAGVLVVGAVIFFDKAKIDDPVGATSVHLVNGIWGTLCVALFGNADVAKAVAGISALPSLGTQVVGIFAVGAFVFTVSLIIWFIIKFTLGIRVTAEEEMMGLDTSEHGNEAYPDFQPVSK